MTDLNMYLLCKSVKLRVLYIACYLELRLSLYVSSQNTLELGMTLGMNLFIELTYRIRTLSCMYMHFLVSLSDLWEYRQFSDQTVH